VRVPVSALRPSAETGSLPPARRPQPELPTRAVAPELMLIGRTTDEVQSLVEKYLDDAFMAGVAHVRLVHGKGTGALRKAVRGVLADHPLVASFRDGEPAEGGAGATVAALKVS
jgi:DNA mismatch repair protein MutS2